MILKNIAMTVFGQNPRYVIGNLASRRVSKSKRELLKAFYEITEAIRTHGTVISDNTPGDSFVCPYDETPQFHVAYQLGDVKMEIHEPSDNDFESSLCRMSSSGRSAVTLKTKSGLSIYARPNIWCRPVFIRFDEGEAKDLLHLHKTISVKYNPQKNGSQVNPAISPT